MLDHRARQGRGAARSRPRGGAAGRAQSVLHDDLSARRWHGRRANAAGRPVRAGRHAADGSGAAGCRSMSSPISRKRSLSISGRACRRRSQVDGYPGHIVEGVVDSLAPGSGSAFSPIPSDNATGNFVRVVQRVPVKIVLDDHSLQRAAAAGHVGGADRRHQGDRRGRARDREAVAHPAAQSRGARTALASIFQLYWIILPRFP